MDKKIVIVGLGLIGGSMAKAFKEYTDYTVCGIDTDKNVLKSAVECGAIDKIGNNEDIKSADIIYLCLYPKADIDFVNSHADLIPSNCIVTDTCGIKSEICAHLPIIAKEHGFTFIGGHPMAGKEKNGFYASEAELFAGASYIIVPCGAPRKAIDLLTVISVKLGFGGTVITTPEHHDRMIAFTSQLPHVLACAYVMSPCCKEHVGYSAGSYRDVSRVANINEKLWTELFTDNKKSLVKELDILINNITDIKNAVENCDDNLLRELLKKGRLIKEGLGE
jgi:prephenate dehydrogenase